MKNEEILVSVIIPAYNAEKYLAFCLDTVTAQTHRNLEIIVVDDGSKDSTGKICDDYAEKDSRIKVIHQQNKGLSAARNAALEIIHGQYIAFIDSDDYIDPRYVEALLKMCTDNDSLISACLAIDTPERKLVELNLSNRTKTFSSIQLLQDLSILEAYYDTVISKLFAAELFKTLRFPVGKLHEDSYIILSLIENAKNITFSEDILYYYYLSPNSIMRSDFSAKNFDILLAYDQKIKVLKRNGCEKSLQKLYCEYIYNVARMKGLLKYSSNFTPEQKKEKMKNLQNKYKELCDLNKCNPCFKGRTKLVTEMLYHFPIIKKFRNTTEG